MIKTESSKPINCMRKRGEKKESHEWNWEEEEKSLLRKSMLRTYIPCGHWGRGEGREKGSGSGSVNSGTESQHSKLLHPNITKRNKYSSQTPSTKRECFSFYSCLQRSPRREREKEIVQTISKEKALNFLFSSLFSIFSFFFQRLCSALTLD